MLKADPEEIVAGLYHYMRNATFSFPELRVNLVAKLASASFRRDLDALTTDIPAEYYPDTAANLVMRELGSWLRNAPPRWGDRSVTSVDIIFGRALPRKYRKGFSWTLSVDGTEPDGAPARAMSPASPSWCAAAPMAWQAV